MIDKTLIAAALLSFAGCAHPPAPRQFGLSSVTPAATGDVGTSIGPNGNTRVDVNVHHLSPPDRVVRGATVYVVWAKQLDARTAPQNLGALRVDSALNGELRTKTVLQAFDLMITPELTAAVDAPTGKSVLQLRVTPRS